MCVYFSILSLSLSLSQELLLSPTYFNSSLKKKKKRPPMPPKKAAPKAASAKKAKTPAKAAPAKAAPAKAPPAKKAAEKRPRSSSSSTASPPPGPASKVAKTASTTAASIVRPPTDEYYKGGGTVYLEGATPWAVKLNQTNIGHNNNKYYIIQLIEEGSGYAVFTRWGRVGESGAHDTFTGDLENAKKKFCAKFKDKTKNDWLAVRTDHSTFVPAPGKYDLVETDNSAAPAAPAGAVAPTGETIKYKPSKLAPPLQAVLNIIFSRDMFKQQMKEKNIDAERMPLGKLTKAQIARGYEALEAVEEELAKARPDQAKLKELSSRFYTIIPHDFGRMVPPAIASAEMVKDKYDLLNMLNDIQIAVAMDEAASAVKTEENPLDKQFKELHCGLTFVDPSSAEYAMIERYTANTQGYRKCKIRRLFSVDRAEDKKRMQAEHGKEREGRYLLWHGTNIAVVAAILKTGLRIMPHAGGRVGRGLYFASENGKSSAYVGCAGKTGVMFLVEVCMGDTIHRITKDDSSLNADKVASLKATSVLACGRQEPSSSVRVKGEWGDIIVPQGKPEPVKEYATSSFSQSEYLVYQESRARIKYLLEMEF